MKVDSLRGILLGHLRPLGKASECDGAEADRRIEPLIGISCSKHTHERGMHSA